MTRPKVQTIAEYLGRDAAADRETIRANLESQIHAPDHPDVKYVVAGLPGDDVSRSPFSQDLEELRPWLQFGMKLGVMKFKRMVEAGRIADDSYPMAHRALVWLTEGQGLNAPETIAVDHPVGVYTQPEGDEDIYDASGGTYYAKFVPTVVDGDELF